MRIYSNFKDYYDIGLAYHDDSIVYERKSQVIERPELEEGLKGIASIARNLKGKYRDELHVYVICDTIHFVRSYYNSPCKEGRRVSFHPYLEDFLEQNFEHFIFIDQKRNDRVYGLIKSMGEFQYEYGAPIIHVKADSFGTYSQIKTNARLADVDFAKVYDPFQMYQKIEMFLANELAQEKNPPIKIEDKYKIQAHGFDKWSFRKRGNQ